MNILLIATLLLSPSAHTQEQDSYAELRSVGFVETPRTPRQSPDRGDHRGWKFGEFHARTLTRHLNPEINYKTLWMSSLRAPKTPLPGRLMTGTRMQRSEYSWSVIVATAYQRAEISVSAPNVTLSDGSQSDPASFDKLEASRPVIARALWTTLAQMLNDLALRRFPEVTPGVHDGLSIGRCRTQQGEDYLDIQEFARQKGWTAAPVQHGGYEFRKGDQTTYLEVASSQAKVGAEIRSFEAIVVKKGSALLAPASFSTLF